MAFPALGAAAAAAIGVIGGMREQDQNAKMAADQRQSDERGAERAMAFNAAEAEKSRVFSAGEASTARDWAERLSSTAHQREIADLRAAGLNPILSGTGGMGSQTPGAAMASSAQAQGVKAGAALAAPAKNLGEAINAAKEMHARTENIKEDTVLKTQLGYGTSARTELDKQQTNLVMEQQETQRALTRGAEANASILANSAKGAELEGEIDETTYGKLMRYINRSVRAVTGGASAYQHTVK